MGGGDEMASERQSVPAVLCIAQSFPPETTPTAIRAGKLLERLSARWDVTVITAGGGPREPGSLRVEQVRTRRPSRLLATLGRLRLGKLAELLIWPDEGIFWLVPALLAGRRLVRETAPSAIVVFMMPYSSGLIGLSLSRLTRLPLILNLDDSPTCTDMHPHYPTRLHHRLARALEDLYVRRADAIIYVSQRNLELVRERQRETDRSKLRLVRYGADREAVTPAAPENGASFEIAYVGAMSGWWSLLGDGGGGWRNRLFERWQRLGRHERLQLDQRSSSPAFIGRAIVAAVGEHPDWEGQVHFTVHGNPYPDWLVERALDAVGVAEVVTVHGPVPHERIAGILAASDLLFLTLPRRIDGSPGGRISAKTYEYLATDLPILAAVPRGENWDYLDGRPGVWLVEPDDSEGMKRAIAELATAKFSGAPARFDRSGLREELSYESRAAEFAAVVEESIGAAR
jgi:glycosyltransferase involved in cell wall biosynthesis